METSHCVVEYDAGTQAVLIAWKKFCCGEEYRAPLRNALELFRSHPGSHLMIDARNGFEDEPADVAWGFTVFIPELHRTGCRNVVFIMKDTSDIEEEMNLWAREFQKYFSLHRTNSVDGAKEFLLGRPERPCE